MTRVLRRDPAASHELVYAWPFPIGAEVDVGCGDDEVVVLCPGWKVGAWLGPGTHAWRSDREAQPTLAYFILTSPTEIWFDSALRFVVPATREVVRLQITGSVLVRVSDPVRLVSQFVGLPFAELGEGIGRSVARSLEHSVAHVVSRRTILAGSHHAVTTPAALPSIVEEILGHNPTSGAVSGLEMVRLAGLTVVSSEGGAGWQAGSGSWPIAASGERPSTRRITSPLEPVRATDAPLFSALPTPSVAPGFGIGLGRIAAADVEEITEVIEDPESLALSELAVGDLVRYRSQDGREIAAMVRALGDGYYELAIDGEQEIVWIPVADVIGE
jgi:hypothetical protein